MRMTDLFSDSYDSQLFCHQTTYIALLYLVQDVRQIQYLYVYVGTCFRSLAQERRRACSFHNLNKSRQIYPLSVPVC